MRTDRPRRHSGHPRGVAIDENRAMAHARARAMAGYDAQDGDQAAAARCIVQIEAEYGGRLGIAQRLLALERLARGESVDATADWLRRLERARRSLNDPRERGDQRRP